MKQNVNTSVKNCTGCSACSFVCPQKCISIKKNLAGFYVSNVDALHCVNCGLCLKVCPQLNNINNRKPLEIYAFSRLDSDLINCSQSGGAFGAISSYCFDQKYFIYGVKLDKDFRVVHFLVRSKRDLFDAFGSKYVQSKIGDSFKDIKKHLLNNQKVLFSGTPCQVAGLYAFLNIYNIPTDNLLTIDIICSNVSSPKIWKASISRYRKYQLLYIDCRDKKYGWKSNVQTYITKKKGALSNSFYANIYNSFLFSNKTCFSCKYKTISRCSDLTIGDFWGIQENESIHSNNNGNSIMLINTEKGKKMLSSLSNDSLVKIDKNSSFYMQKCLESNWSIPNHFNFFQILVSLFGGRTALFAFKIKAKIGGFLKRYRKN